MSLGDLPQLEEKCEWERFFAEELFAYADPLLQKYAQQLGFSQIPLRIRLVKSKWGSCSYDNRIMLNQQLVHLPTRLIQYVVVHEACHLIEKNHAPGFWQLVA
ncbi:MAG: M48 family metallopeptidase [bacterium]|nr:M48 family metallopeptidase [bacterium]